MAAKLDQAERGIVCVNKQVSRVEPLQAPNRHSPVIVEPNPICGGLVLLARRAVAIYSRRVRIWRGLGAKQND
jgi:hypothetical protein